jgi:hypothetical protein
MANTLQTGSDSLTLADSNEEGANLLALQTRQQLSTSGAIPAFIYGLTHARRGPSNC